MPFREPFPDEPVSSGQDFAAAVPTLQKRITTVSGRRSPVPTKIERISH
jgi:hypothetical protein